MAFKHRVHHWFRFIRAIKTWQLIIILILSIGASAYLLRQNNLGMVERREAVKLADENNGNVKQALLDLQHYVSQHMNTGLGDGLVLQSAYQRAYNAALQKSLNTTNPNSQLYTQVELECRSVFARTHSFPQYTQCAHDKLSSLAPGQDPLAKFTPPATELFRYNYVSPAWSPDLAGLMVLLTGLIGLIILSRSIAYWAIRAILRSHQ